MPMVSVQASPSMVEPPTLMLAQKGQPGPIVPEGEKFEVDSETQFAIGNTIFSRASGDWLDDTFYFWLYGNNKITFQTPGFPPSIVGFTPLL